MSAPSALTPAAAVPYSAFDIVAISASLGGIEALSEILPGLPEDFPAIVTLVQHVAPHSSGLLPRILTRHSRMPVAHVEPDELLKPGRIYVAPPDHHFFIRRDGRANLLRSQPVKFTRPAADPLLVSAAMAFGPRTLGVVLTGASSDGASGAQAIKWAGGMVLAQDEQSSVAFSMPRAAIATGCVDLVLPLSMISPAIMALVMARGAAEFLRVPLQAA
jgi:two-component system, chemotaxis family, protein-glutamate methylesterase/glutaminase